MRGVRVGVLGLAFKPGTDDVRDAPALELLQALVAEDAIVAAYDPVALESARPELPNLPVRFADDAGEASYCAQALVLMTEWPEIVNCDWPEIARQMDSPRFIFDGRNALNPKAMRAAGFEYAEWGATREGGLLTRAQQGEKMMPDRNVLITGAAGFAGSNLAKALLARGYGVTGLDVVAPNHAGLLRDEFHYPNFRYLWKSVQDIQPSDIAGHSVVAHLAAQPDTPMAFDSPRYTVMQNVGGTVDLLEAVRRAGGVSKVLFAASGNETGRPLYLPIDEDHPLTPHNPTGSPRPPPNWPCGPGIAPTGYRRWCCPPGWSPAPICAARSSCSSGCGTRCTAAPL